MGARLQTKPNLLIKDTHVDQKSVNNTGRRRICPCHDVHLHDVDEVEQLSHPRWPAAKVLCQLDSQPVGLLRREKNIIIGCMDQTLMCLTNKVGEHSLRSLLGLSGQTGLAAKVAIANLLH